MALAGRTTVRFSIGYARPPREFVSSVHGIIDSSRIPARENVRRERRSRPSHKPYQKSNDGAAQAISDARTKKPVSARAVYCIWHGQLKTSLTE